MEVRRPTAGGNDKYLFWHIFESLNEMMSKNGGICRVAQLLLISAGIKYRWYALTSLSGPNSRSRPSRINKHGLRRLANSFQAVIFSLIALNLPTLSILATSSYMDAGPVSWQLESQEKLTCKDISIHLNQRG
jgi:hypothetical protein